MTNIGPSTLMLNIVIYTTVQIGFIVKCLSATVSSKSLNAHSQTVNFGEKNKRMYFMRATFGATLLPRRLCCDRNISRSPEGQASCHER